MDDLRFSLTHPHALEAAPVSSGNAPELHPGIVSDIEKLQRLFPSVVSRWLREHFRDKEHIAYFFDIDERSARNWLSGLNCPSGPRAVAMILQFPDLRGRVLQAMAEAA